MKILLAHYTEEVIGQTCEFAESNGMLIVQRLSVHTLDVLVWVALHVPNILFAGVTKSFFYEDRALNEEWET